MPLSDVKEDTRDVKSSQDVQVGEEDKKKMWGPLETEFKIAKSNVIDDVFN
jgi:hypothetical protein